MALLALYLCLVQFIVTAVILDDGLDHRPQFWKQLWWFSPTLFKIGLVVSEENNSFKKFTTTDAKSIHDPFRSAEIFFPVIIYINHEFTAHDGFSSNCTGVQKPLLLLERSAIQIKWQQEAY
jgi:hypothetical protein